MAESKGIVTVEGKDCRPAGMGQVRLAGRLVCGRGAGPSRRLVALVIDRLATLCLIAASLVLSYACGLSEPAASFETPTGHRIDVLAEASFDIDKEESEEVIENSIWGALLQNSRFKF